VDLDVENVVILGQGNVALDVARILLTPIDILKVMALYAMENRLHFYEISQARIRRFFYRDIYRKSF
jgi:adrenodoxin-NADP+ reductase